MQKSISALVGAIAPTFYLTVAGLAGAQIVPDTTLPANSIVTPSGNVLTIEGGTRAGGNLFHSFQEFSVPANVEAVFNNSLDVQHIFSRVTGIEISEINGTIRANGMANLFLINPNGIVFGGDARLDVGGSFFGTTANGVLFQDGTSFNASDPTIAPLLTVSVPVGLQFNTPQNPGMGAIRVEGLGNVQLVSNNGVATLGTGLAPQAGEALQLNASEPTEGLNLEITGTLEGLGVGADRTLALVGRGVDIAGGTLRTAGGNIAIGSVSAGVVSLDVTSPTPLGFEGVSEFQDVRLSESAAIDTSAHDVSGSIQIQGRQILFQDGAIAFARVTGGASDITSGEIAINATERVEIGGISRFADNLGDRQASAVIAGTVGATDGGSITIFTGDLVLQGGGVISNSTIGFGAGNAGNIDIVASGEVSLSGTNELANVPSAILSGTRSLGNDAVSTGNGGTISIRARSLSVAAGGRLAADTRGSGDGGGIAIEAESISLRDGAQLAIDTSGTGNGGFVLARTTSLTLTNGASIEATTEGEGNAGSVDIVAQGTVSLISTSDSRSFIATASEPSNLADGASAGEGGNLNIEAESLSLENSRLFSSTRGSGDAGDVSIHVRNTVTIAGDSNIASATGGSGNAGDVSIQSGNILALLDGGEVTVATQGTGSGGTLTAIAGNTILIRGVSVPPEGQNSRASGLVAGASSDGSGGSILISTPRLLVRGGGTIFAGTRGSGAGGDIQINNAALVELRGAGLRSDEVLEDLDFLDTEPDPTAMPAMSAPSRISTESSGSGSAGSITVNTRTLLVRDAAQISVGSTASNAGELDIIADDILLDAGSRLSAETAVGDEANISLQTNTLQLRRNSSITTNATGDATGGNITIQTDTLVALENSDISANAEQGFGGRVLITAEGIFGTEFRVSPTTASDITASSQRGADFDGEVELGSPEVNTDLGLIELPRSIVDVTALLDRDPCARDDGSRFVATGQGGLPANPADPLYHGRTLVDLGTWSLNPELVEAQSWTVAADGTVELTAPTSVSDLVGQAIERYQAADYATAAALWQQAATTFAERGDAVSLVKSLSNLAIAYGHLGDWQSADRTLSQALQLLEGEHGLEGERGRFGVGELESSPPPTPFLPPTPLLAQVLNARGILAYGRGRSLLALQLWQQAEAAYQQAEDGAGVVRARLNQAQVLYFLGFNPAARKLLEQTQPLWEELSDEELSDVALTVAGLRSYGEVWSRVGNPERAENLLEQSLALAKQLNDPQAQAATLLSLGNFHRHQRDLPQAIALYKQAAELAVDPLLQAQASLNRLSTLLDPERQQLFAARRLRLDLQTQLASLPPSHFALYARLHFTRAAIALQPSTQDSNIDRWLTDTAELAETLGDRTASAYALGYLGEIHEQRQQWQQAETLTQKALQAASAFTEAEHDATPAAIASLLNIDLTYQWQWQLGRVLAAQGEYERAIASYSNAFDLLQKLRSDLAVTTSESQFAFRDTVEPFYRQYLSLLLPPENGTFLKADNTSSQARLERSRQVVESLQLAELDNFFQDACVASDRPIAPRKGERQEDPTAAMLHVMLLADRVEVILDLPGQPLQRYSANVAPSEVIAAIRQLKRGVYENPLRRGSLDDAYLTPAQTLYNWLIRPITADLTASQIDTLVFVLDSDLRDLPIATLHDGDRHLIEQYALAIAPGLRLTDTLPSTLAGNRFRVLGAGATDAPSFQQEQLSPLQEVARELEQIKQVVPGRQLLNEAFTREALATAIADPNFAIVHLATHGQFSSRAEDTFVLAYDRRIKASELDGLLRQRNQSQGRATPLELLVLSACQTAAGDDRAALGLAGVAVRAGARSTLATLWLVDDRAAAAVMSQFYRELAAPDTPKKAEAIRRAQVSLMAKPNYQHPFYWAPYILVGNWR